MKIRRILCFLLALLSVMQLTLLYIENNFLQGIAPERKKSRTRRTLSGQTVDSTGRYRIHRFFKSEGFGLYNIQPKDVTLTSHCTVDKLHYIIDLVESWGGPMSISVFAPGSDAAFAEDVIDGLRLCWPLLRKLASFHLVYPKDKRFRANMTDIGGFAYYSCKDITRKMLQRKLSDNGLHPKYGKVGEDDPLHYPHNLMRNIALSGTLTEFILPLDIDMVPSSNLSGRFLQFAELEGALKLENLAFVLPAFEMKEEEEYTPRNAKDLLLTLNNMNARPLLQETCPQCHKATNYDRWTSLIDDDKNIDVAYVALAVAGWEPYFIARRDIARYDENILKNGQDRLSHICELRANKISFAVLKGAFLVRRSIKYKSSMKGWEILRKDERAKFHERLRDRLRESGKIQDEDIRAC